MTSSLKKRPLWISYAFLSLGLGFIGWLVYKLGPASIYNHLRLLRWNFLLFLIPSVLNYIFFTESWDVFLKSVSLKISWTKLFMIKTIGEAVNTVNPLNWGGGDPLRIYLLKKSIPLAESTASVVIDRTLNSIALVVFMLLGIFLAFLKFDFPPFYKIGFVASILWMIGLTYYLYRRQHEGIFQFLVDLLNKMRIKKHWSEASLEKFKQIDRLIIPFYTQHRTGFLVSFLFQFVTRLLGVVEIYLAAYFLKAPLGWIICYLLASITAILNMLFVFIPGTVGVLEGAYAVFFHFLHQDPALGTSIQILRRFRVIVWTALGFYFLHHLDRKTRPAFTEMEGL